MRATGDSFLFTVFDPIVSCTIGSDLTDRLLRAVGLVGSDLTDRLLRAAGLAIEAGHRTLKLIGTSDARPRTDLMRNAVRPTRHNE